MVATDTRGKPSAHRTTWLDVLDGDDQQAVGDDLITRQELLDTLREQGVEVNEVTLVHWEKRGAVPRPVRRRRHGAPPRALYPRRAIGTITYLKRLQANGYSLDELTPLVWAHARDRDADPAEPIPPRDFIARMDFNTMRDAVTHELYMGLPAGTIVSVDLQFKDATGKTVFTGRHFWSPEWAEVMRNVHGWQPEK